MTYDRALDCLAEADESSRPVWSVRPSGLGAALSSLPEAAAAFARGSGFRAEAGQLVLLPGADGVVGAVAGLGADRTLWAHAGLPGSLPAGTAWRLEPGDFDPAEAALGFCLGAYRYNRLSQPKRLPARLAGADAHRAALVTARAAWFGRDLINTPANLLGPAELAEAAVQLGRRFGAEAGTIEGEALRSGYPAIAAVGQGSGRPPLVAWFRWQGSGAAADSRLVSLCGKGVCFDSGGYDLKPSAGMLRMKKDMGGAALILALAQVIMALDLPVRLAVRIGCVENMVSGEAMRPLDVLRTRRGLTVEVGNTDAEGRLVLCDLLAEAADEAPALLIDAATLTGAARVALGPDLPAVFTRDDEVAAALDRSGRQVADPIWRLPLHAEYDGWLSSTVADLGNVSSKPHAGAITAALFLQRFVGELVSWVHIDCYAWNDQSRAGRPEGGDVQGFRALAAYIREVFHDGVARVS